MRSIFQRLAMSSAPPHSSPQRLRFGEFLVDIVCFINNKIKFTYLLTS